jgi:hypothetical protein
MKTPTLSYKLTKEEVRAWLHRRHASREPLPDREHLLQQLAWKTADSDDLSAATFPPSDQT